MQFLYRKLKTIYCCLPLSDFNQHHRVNTSIPSINLIKITDFNISYNFLRFILAFLWANSMSSIDSIPSYLALCLLQNIRDYFFTALLPAVPRHFSVVKKQAHKPTILLYLIDSSIKTLQHLHLTFKDVNPFNKGLQLFHTFFKDFRSLNLLFKAFNSFLLCGYGGTSLSLSLLQKKPQQKCNSFLTLLPVPLLLSPLNLISLISLSLILLSF